MKTKYFLFIFLLCFFFSCAEEDNMVISNEMLTESSLQMEQAKIAIYAMGLDTTFISEWDRYYVVEEDILVCKDSVNLSRTLTRQYKTTYHVDNFQTITIGVDNTIASNTNWREAVQEVIVLYNKYTGLKFVYAAGGVRDHTESHRKLLQEHGWTKYFDVDLMDAEGPDVVWPIPNGKVLKENHVGKHILHYDSMLVLAHFKGHPMGGYGGALKQLAIGCASRAGKALIHSAGKTDDRFKTWEQRASSVVFPEAMADAASSVIEHFRGKIGSNT